MSARRPIFPTVPSAIGHATGARDDSAQLTDFARACKAAARAVLLYPAAHPAAVASLLRLVELTSARELQAPLRITALADRLLVDGQPPAPPDSAVAELAALLHDHSIGELTVTAGGDADAWRSFLLLLGRKREAVHAEGGISRLWSSIGGRHVEIREIDYAEVLREDRDGGAAAWEDIVATCLQGGSPRISADAMREMLEEGGGDRVSEIIEALQTRATAAGWGTGPTAAALGRLLQSIVDAVARHAPERVDDILRNLAEGTGRLSPDMLLALVAASRDTGGRGDSARSGASPEDGACAAVDAVIDHMSDRTIARFVATNGLARGESLERVAQAFQVLVPNPADRSRMLDLAHGELSSSQAAATPAFDGIWRELVQKLLADSPDRPVDRAAAADAARSDAIDLEDVSDDPPARVAAWLATLAPDEIRKLDGALIQDLLRIESDDHRWTALLAPTTALLDDLCLVGDFEAACEVLAAALRHQGGNGERRAACKTAIKDFVSGPATRHIVGHLASIDDSELEAVKRLCTLTGVALISPLAEALAGDDRIEVRRRLTAMVTAFGAAGRREVERLKSSPNAAVRRAAVHLLRELGGSDALPELTELLDDSAPQVQREAVRAIVDIGTDAAYAVLEQALVSGTARSREAIMQAVSTIRDERATPLLVHIVRHIDWRGQLRPVYLRAIDALATLKGSAGVTALSEALRRGHWWAPRRTALMRGAAAAALARLGTTEAVGALEDAAQSGSRGVRKAARGRLRALAAEHRARGAA